MFKLNDTVEYPQERISAEIQRLTACNQTITIASDYKSLILTQPIRILNILPDRVICQAPEYRLCFTLHGKVHLYSHALPQAVNARLLEVDIVVGKIALSNLTYSGQRWKERLSDRIQPRESICVDMSWNNNPARGHLENLSTTGMRVMISRTKDKIVCTNCNAPVRLTFQLPGDGLKMDLKGSIVYSRQVGNLVIVGFRLLPGKSQEKRINQYILARKAEILDELEWAFQNMFEHRQNQDLYF